VENLDCLLGQAVVAELDSRALLGKKAQEDQLLDQNSQKVPLRRLKKIICSISNKM
jgi:hypothetical protein